MRKMVLWVVLGVLLSSVVFAVEMGSKSDAGALKPHALFGDNMVLQRDTAVSVWGVAPRGATVTVKIDGQEKKAMADHNGCWRVILDPTSTGVNRTMLISTTEETRTFNNVAFGDVWLCSGQSNMAMAVRKCQDYKHEISQANYPEIRYFAVPRRSLGMPDNNLPAVFWSICSPETVADFSGTAYFFAKNLYNELHVPVGLINSSVGGTPVEAWISVEVLKSNPDFMPIHIRYNNALEAYPEAKKKYDEEMMMRRTLSFEKVKNLPRIRQPMHIGHPQAPSGLYNAMISPLLPYSLKGVVWYQGETNVYRACQYGKLLQAMINDWRMKWGQGEFPFLIVQLASYMKPKDVPVPDIWAELREAQAKTLRLPGTALAVAIDLGEADNIHPGNKQEVGYRLALAAFHHAYGKHIVWSGPVYKSMKQEEQQIGIEFEHVGSGLMAKNGKLQRFAIAGADRKFYWAEAVIKGNSVLVWSEKVSNPVAVRYAWESNPEGCNLYNNEGLPAVPFRTDDWPGITEGRK